MNRPKPKPRPKRCPECKRTLVNGTCPDDQCRVNLMHKAAQEAFEIPEEAPV